VHNRQTKNLTSAKGKLQGKSLDKKSTFEEYPPIFFHDRFAASYKSAVELKQENRVSSFSIHYPRKYRFFYWLLRCLDRFWNYSSKWIHSFELVSLFQLVLNASDRQGQINNLQQENLAILAKFSRPPRRNYFSKIVLIHKSMKKISYVFSLSND